MNRRTRLKMNAMPEPSKYLLENNEEKENVQKRQLVIKKQMMREEEGQDNDK